MERRREKPIPFKPAPLVPRIRIVDEKDLTAGNTQSEDLDEIQEKLDQIQKRLDEFYKTYLKDKIREEERRKKR